MSRRESRSSLGNRQSDALFEFENFKKKFLLANKHITKLNSTLSVRIEELNGQISTLYVENLRLRASEIALAAQLKRERDKSRKIIGEAEAATQSLMKHLSQLRTSYDINEFCESPPTPPSPKARRPIVNIDSPTSLQFNRISRPPNFPGIYEEEECLSSDEENRKPTKSPKKKSKPKPRISGSKLPMPTRPTSPIPPLPEQSLGTHLDLTSVTSNKRKPSRRPSGLLTVDTEALSVPRSGSPAFGSPVRREAGLAEAEEEMEAVSRRLIYEAAEQDVSDTPLAKREKERRRGKVREPSDIKAGTSTALEDVPRPRKKDRPREDSDSSEGLKPKSVYPSSSRNALQPIDSNVRELSDHEPRSSSTRHFLVADEPLPVLPTSQRSVSPSATSDHEGAGSSATGREKRTRKSVNYAEPKLNTKMRKPDGFVASKKKRSSAAAVLSALAFKSPSDPDGNDADGDTDARSSLEFQSGGALPLRGANGNSIDPSLFPLPPTRPGSAAAMYSPGPPARTSGSTTTSGSSSSLASNATSGSSGTVSLKRKKSRPLDSDEDSDDGAEADEEFMTGSRSVGGPNWINVEGRRKALPKRSAAAAAVAALEDIRRHSMIL